MVTSRTPAIPSTPTAVRLAFLPDAPTRFASPISGSKATAIPPSHAQGATIFSEVYSAGDYLEASYRIQSAKISWDYLSYTFRNHIRFKTLYEVQWVTVSTTTFAPFVAQTTDAQHREHRHEYCQRIKEPFLSHLRR